MSREVTITGTITAAQLARFGKASRLYGYVTIRKTDGTPTKVKVDSRTNCESISVGDSVEVHAVELGETGIFLARRVVLVPGPFYAHDDAPSSEAGA